MRKTKVLLVDSDEKHLAEVSAGLESKGFEVDVATSGEAALTRLGERKGTPGPAVKVLLVDDEADYVHSLAERLEMRGFDVEVATSGQEALSKVKGEHFTTVVLDVAMPGMDGVDTLKALQKYDATLSFMLLTGQATIKAAMEATRLGAVDVLEKPTDITTLEEKLRAMCA